MPGVRIEVLPRGQTASVDFDRDGFEFGGRFLLRGQLGQQVPVFHRPEPHPLAFPVHNQTHGHALHASGGTGLTAELAPQQRRDVVTVEPVQNAAGFLGADQRLVDSPRALQRPANRVAGDFVEDHAMHRDLGLQNLLQMPGDGFPFPVFVGGQVEGLGLLEQFLQLFDLLAFVGGDHINGLEVLLDVHAQVRPRLFPVSLGQLAFVLGQIADVSDGGLDHVILAQELADGASLGRRFDNDQRLGVFRLFARWGVLLLFGHSGKRLCARVKGSPRAGGLPVPPRAAAERNAGKRLRHREPVGRPQKLAGKQFRSVAVFRKRPQCYKRTVTAGVVQGLHLRGRFIQSPRVTRHAVIHA